MKYQQINLSRLAHAKEKLIDDGAWHPFQESPGTHYRIVERFMQRVRFERGEDDSLLRQLVDFPPIPSLLLKEGFREELTFRIEDDHWVFEGPLIRKFSGWEKMMQGAKHLHVGLETVGTDAMRFHVNFERWETGMVLRAMTLVRACTHVASDLAADAREGIEHTAGAVQGLMRNACDVLMEEVAVKMNKKSNRKGVGQSSLFDGE